MLFQLENFFVEFYHGFFFCLEKEESNEGQDIGGKNDQNSGENGDEGGDNNQNSGENDNEDTSNADSNGADYEERGNPHKYASDEYDEVFEESQQGKIRNRCNK